MEAKNNIHISKPRNTKQSRKSSAKINTSIANMQLYKT